MPEVKKRYRTTDETAIVGESLAGFFVVETFFLEPDLFDTYIAIDPSLWWNDHKLVDGAAASLYARPRNAKALFLASSSEFRGDVDATALLAEIPARRCAAGYALALRKDARREARDDLSAGGAQGVSVDACADAGGCEVSASPGCRHSRESGNPCRSSRVRKWIPAFAGMTASVAERVACVSGRRASSV